jgi:hypothetical protein
MIWTTLTRFALVTSFPLFAVACVVSSEPSGYAPPSELEGSGGGSATVTSSTADGGPSEHPILAPVDTGQTMTAAPGQGVGVFTEYDAGGHWYIWWTCDSTLDSNPPCDFDVKVSAQSGAVTNAVSQEFEQGDVLTQASPAQIEANTRVSTGLDGVRFDTDPGATITLSATVGQQYSGQFIFFVEGGKVDDGFSGTVTDPIQLVGSTP